MSEQARMRLSWLFVVLVMVSAVVVFLGGVPAGASDDHDRVRDYRRGGDIIPLAQILAENGLTGSRIIEAELEDEHGRLVYELELLGDDGRVYERYFDATTGEPGKGLKDD